MDYTRILKTRADTLEHTFYVGETGTDSSTTVTVAVTDANGTSVTSGSATSAGVGRYTFALAGQAQTMLLTVTWTGTIAGASVTETGYAEVVGGFFFTLVEGRASDATLADTGKYPTTELIAKRLEVEVECEEICDRAFVPRYKRITLDGSGTSELMLAGVNEIRSIRSVKMATGVGETFTALTAGQLAKLAVTPDRVVLRTDGDIWLEGRSNVIVELEHGLDVPPTDLKRAALRRFRASLNAARSGVPDRALSFTTDVGGTYRLSMPGAYTTGIPDVDAAYERYSLRSGVGGGEDPRDVPASRLLNFDSQHYSLFHGGVR